MCVSHFVFHRNTSSFGRWKWRHRGPSGTTRICVPSPSSLPIAGGRIRCMRVYFPVDLRTTDRHTAWERDMHECLLFFFSTLFFQSVCFSSWRCKRGPTTVYLHAVRASVWVAILLRSIKSKQLAGKVFYRGMFQRLAFSHLYTSWVFLIVAQS